MGQQPVTNQSLTPRDTEEEDEVESFNPRHHHHYYHDHHITKTERGQELTDGAANCPALPFVRLFLPLEFIRISISASAL